jgi:hypothetical protein
MAKYKYVPVLLEDYEALDVGADDVVESFAAEDGSLVIRAVRDFGDFVCSGGCEECPVGEASCHADCFRCPCLAGSGFCRCGGKRLGKRIRKDGYA